MRLRDRRAGARLTEIQLRVLDGLDELVHTQTRRYPI